MSEIVSVFGINSKLLLIQAVNFGVLLVVLWYFLYRPVMDMIEKRQETIAKGVRDAERAGEELKLVEKEKSGLIHEARLQSEGIVKEAKARGLEEERSLARRASLKSKAILDEATRESFALKERVLAGSREEIAKLAILGAEKVLKNK